MSTQDHGDRAAANDPGASASATAAEERTSSTDDSAGSAKGARQGGKTPAPDDSTPDTLGELMAELRKRQSELATTIKQGKASLADRESQQQKVKKQLADLDRAAGDLERTRTDSQSVLDDAQKALDDARPLIDQLDDDVEEALGKALAAIDKAIADKQAEVDVQAGEVPKLESERDRLQRAWVEQQVAHDAASARLTGLPAAIKQTTARLKALRSELVAATTAGHAAKACVLALEVTARKTELEDLRDPSYEADLIEAVTDAGTALSAAGDALADGQSALTERQAKVDELKAELTALWQSRAAKVQQLYDAPSDAASAAPAA
ncbi:hypothetical protein FHU33_2299 [Blastococcus colisei]|uniref:Uncharacterized protein n=1 Tax=Blastococcus colisei TaxID=1564162 RepID=A0A543PFN4_9ACTN|nr:hypothetical protein [Blastococcus colisei]TQN42888.1 hypothetical protein FHU33_2299 [Blastococcus colisei]